MDSYKNSLIPTTESMKQSLDELDKEENKLKNNINMLLNQEDNFEKAMRKIYECMPNLQLMLEDTKELSMQIDFAHNLASSVSKKGKQLENTKSMVASTLQRVSDILDLKFCTQNIEKALTSKNYEKAAAHIHRFLSIDENNLKKSTLINEDPNLNLSSLDEAFVKLHEAEHNLQQIILKSFDEAANKHDKQNVERFFKIFPFLNQYEIGLRKYSNYLCKTLENESSNKDIEENNYIVKLKKLFEQIAKIIDQNQPLIETYYGPGNLLECIEIIQNECDRKANKIIDDFENSRNLKHINLVSENLKSIDSILNEITTINLAGEKYLLFIYERLTKDIEALDNKSEIFKNKSTKINFLYKNCELSRKVKNFNYTYLLLEKHYLEESYLKAIELDETEANNVTSSMLDDIFFITKKSIQRAISGGSLITLCNVIEQCELLLKTTFLDVLNERLRNGFSSSSAIANALDLSQAYNALQSGRYLGNTKNTEKSKQQFLTALNNLDVAIGYITSFKSTIIEDAKREIADLTKDNNIEILIKSLDLFDSIKHDFKAKNLEGICLLNKNILKPKLKSWTSKLSMENHIINQTEMAKYEVTEGLRAFTTEFLINIDSSFQSIKPSLTINNYENLVNSFSEEFSHKFQIELKYCRFNKLGAYQLSRELRTIINYLTALTNLSMLEMFSKIKHITSILNLEDLNELNIIYQNIKVTGLSKEEIKEFLKLRTDFSNESVEKINF